MAMWTTWICQLTILMNPAFILAACQFCWLQVWLDSGVQMESRQFFYLHCSVLPTYAWYHSQIGCSLVEMAPRFSFLGVHEVSKRVSTNVSGARFWVSIPPSEAFFKLISLAEFWVFWDENRVSDWGRRFWKCPAIKKNEAVRLRFVPHKRRFMIPGSLHTAKAVLHFPDWRLGPP